MASVASSADISCFVGCSRCSIECPKAKNSYQMSSTSGSGHRCAQNVLLARVAGSPKWYRVRDRSYQSTSSTWSMAKQHCSCNDLICPDAHSNVEHLMWQLEMDGKQNIFEIITSRRNLGLSTLDNVGSYFMTKYGGLLSCICAACCYECSENGETCSGPEGHDWNSHKELVHSSVWNSPFTVVEMQTPGHCENLSLCGLLGDCPEKGGACAKHHTFIARDFVFVRRHCAALTMEQVCQLLNNLKITTVHQLDYRTSLPCQNSPDFQFELVCKECLRLGVPDFKNGSSDACRRGHSWDLSVTAAVLDVSSGKWIMVKPLPRRLPKDASRLDICWYVATSRSCYRQDQCQFAHSPLEKDVWAWQMKDKGLTLLTYYCHLSVGLYVG